MKPLGMTADFRIVKPSRAEDKIWEAVEEAIDAGWSPQRFRQEAADAWENAKKEQHAREAEELRR